MNNVTTVSAVYFDASALLKPLLVEEGADLVNELWIGAGGAFSSRLGDIEVRAGLAAAHRARRIDAAGLSRALSVWDRQSTMLWPVELTRAVADEAGTIAATYGLTGADAVHLASALSLSAGELVVAVFDQRLRQACLDAGLAVAG